MAGTPYGLQNMLKEGHQHISGLEEAVMKNIEACKAISQIARTSLGPNGAQHGDLPRPCKVRASMPAAR